MRLPHIKQQSGIMLIENLVALAIVLIGLLGVLAAELYAMRQSGQVQYQANAAYAAQQIASAAFAQCANNLPALNQLNNLQAPAGSATGNALSQAEYEWSNYITNNLPQGTGLLTVNNNSSCSAYPCQLTVTIGWTGADHLSHQYQITQMIGLQ